VAFKIPVSVLVVIHTPDLQCLLIERARHPGFWQSVTGSLDSLEESPVLAAAREVAEETGIDVAAPGHLLRDWQESQWYDIFPEWRERYALGVTRNLEHVFSLEIPAPCQVILSPGEHIAQCWLPQREAAEKVFSPTNRSAILRLR
jgi:dATP pyrophosphohydrolase